MSLFTNNMEIRQKWSLPRLQFADGYDEHSVIVKWLWETLRAMDQQHKKAFLHFVTGSSRVPIRGLGKVIITVQRHGPDTDRLPSAMFASVV